MKLIKNHVGLSHGVLYNQCTQKGENWVSIAIAFSARPCWDRVQLAQLNHILTVREAWEKMLPARHAAVSLETLGSFSNTDQWLLHVSICRQDFKLHVQVSGGNVFFFFFSFQRSAVYRLNVQGYSHGVLMSDLWHLFFQNVISEIMICQFHLFQSSTPAIN